MRIDTQVKVVSMFGNISAKEYEEKDPVYKGYFASGELESKIWGKPHPNFAENLGMMVVHREIGPAIIWYWKNGNIRSKQWYKNDKKIKTIKFDESGRQTAVYDGNGRQIN